MNVKYNLNDFNDECISVPKGMWETIVSEKQSLQSQLNVSQTANTTLNITIDRLREENQLLREKTQKINEELQITKNVNGKLQMVNEKLEGIIEYKKTEEVNKMVKDFFFTSFSDSKRP